MTEKISIAKIWIEIDEFDISEKALKNEDYCNAIVYFSNGTSVGLNIWSETFLYTQIQQLTWIDNQVAELPDLVMRKLDSESIRKAILALEQQENWFRGRGYQFIPEQEEE